MSDAALSGNPIAMERDGARLNSRGAELVKDGEKMLARGRKQIREGEAFVQSGGTLVRNSRFEYREQSSATGRASTPESVAKEAKRLRAIGKDWEDGIDTIRKGNALVKNGNKNIENGQSAIRRGREMLERGSTLIRNSQRARFGEDLLPDRN